jgi:CRISPR type I-E-associated protein CasB/Cse2
MSHASRFNKGGIARWHGRLTGMKPDAPEKDSNPDDVSDVPPQRGDRAELKRAQTSGDVMLSPSFATLTAFCYPSLLDDGNNLQGVTPDEIATLARTAMILAHVDRCTIGRSPAEAFAEGIDRPAVSIQRITNLLRTEDVEDSARQIRMMMPMISGGIDPVRLHNGLSWWEDARKEWALAYYLAIQKNQKNKQGIVADLPAAA